MIPFDLGQTAAAVEGVLRGAPASARVRAVTLDSRTAAPGELFVPIKGARFDAHDFIPGAMKNGALCALSERPVITPHILVKNTLDALQALAGYYRSLAPARAVGITGSAGKTTTKEFIAAALSEGFDVLKAEGNLNNQTGVPQTLFRLEEHHELAVIELGTNHFGEIDRLAKMVRPEVCVYTNVGTAHMEFLGSKEGILRAKSEMLAHMAPGGAVFINGDDEYLKKLLSRADAHSFGLGRENELYAADIDERGLEGTAFTAVGKNVRQRVFVPAPGTHMILNALAALSVALHFGMEPQRAAAGIAKYTPVGGRMAMEKTGGVTIINDSYNANPDSMCASLGVLAAQKGRRIAVLGGMGELGANSDELHRQVGRAVRRLKIDCLMCIGEGGALIAEGAGYGERFDSVGEFLGAAGGLFRSGDTVLIKASRACGLERAADGIAQILKNNIKNEK